MSARLTIIVDDPAHLGSVWARLKEDRPGAHVDVDIDHDGLVLVADLRRPEVVATPPTVMLPPIDQGSSLSTDVDPELVARNEDPAPEPEDDAVEADPDDDVAEPDNDVAEPDNGGELTCQSAVLAVLAGEPDVAFGLTDIADAVEGNYKQSTVTFTVRELTNAGRIRRVGRGLYQALR